MFTREELKNFIYEKYRTLKACADALDIDEATLSRNMNRCTDQFLERLRGVGVPIPINSEVALKQKKSANQKSVANSTIHYGELNSELIALLKDMIASQKETIMELRSNLRRCTSYVDTLLKQKGDDDG